MWTHAHPMLRNTSKGHRSNTCAPPNLRWPRKFHSSSKVLQNSSKAPKAPPRTPQRWKLAPPNSKWPPNLQSCSKYLQNSSKAPKAPPTVQTYTSNTHKPTRSLSMHTSKQTSNDAICMGGPITCWKSEERCWISEERLHISKHIDHTSMWAMLGERVPTLLQPCSLFPSLYHHIDKPYGITISLPPYSNMLVVLTYLKSTYVFDYLQH